MRSPLVELLGFPATLIHGDTLVLDRWLWLKQHLPAVPSGSKRLLDVGCGSGAFTIGAALRGYRTLGLSWDERNMVVARHRASICNAPLATFEVQDIRQLETRPDLHDSFELVICCEAIEHILDDRKLMLAMSRCLKLGGELLLTTPNFNYRPITKSDDGPFSQVEDGWHVRRGYTAQDLRALCAAAGLKVAQIGYCSGFVSQRITRLMRAAGAIHPVLGWGLVLPLRPLPPLVDGWVSRILHWPGYSITLTAKKE
jgi:SAM-dependent methyltransferase